MVELRLVEAAAGCSADDPAWQTLWRWVEPQLWAMVDRPRFATHLAHTEPARQRIVTAIHARLVADRCHLLQCFLDARRLNARLGFARWLRTIAKRIAMSYITREVPAAAVCRRSARRLVR